MAQINASLDQKSLIRDAAFLLVMNALARKMRLVVFFHGWEDQTAKGIGTRIWCRKVFLYVLRKATRILVLASRFKEELIRLGIDEDKVDVYTTMFDGNLCIRMRNIRKTSVETILFLSRLIKEKGVLELLEAFKKLSQIYPKLQLVIAGDGAIRKDLEQWVVANQLTPRVHFAGFVSGEDKADQLYNADLFVLPTYYGEGCPVALLEAMAAALPLVTTRAGGIPDVVQEPENGILLDEVNENSIMTAVRRFIESPDLVREVSKNNYDKAWSQLEASIVSRKLAALYRDIVRAGVV
ncbi:MAG: glycosyltransferase [Gammaproteobacteria bacterium]|nr:glycosyltransferase [Gammaproteobacteria bacterium]